MTPSRVHEGSVRAGRLDVTRLAWAFGLSLAVHLFCYSTYVVGRETGLWARLQLPAWIQKLKALAEVPKQPTKPPPDREIPLTFLDVNPLAATADAPKDAKYYSDKNSQAANPDADKETDTPKIDGKQTDLVRTEDVPKVPRDQSQPSFPKADREQPPETAKPKNPTPPGDLAMAKPDVTLRQGDGTAEQNKPRTIKEALTRQNRTQLVGEKMKQEGGTSRRAELSSLDAKATPFGAYDAAFIRAVEQRWFDLLDNISYDGYRRGKVVVQFRLNYDGTISDLKVTENNVNSTTLMLMCQKAISDPAPYDKWPREMRLMVDKNYRELQFAFFYY
jgi:hypothetical protein